jgi:hypothetical protein
MLRRLTIMQEAIQTDTWLRPLRGDNAIAGTILPTVAFRDAELVSKPQPKVNWVDGPAAQSPPLRGRPGSRIGRLVPSLLI